MKTTFYYIPDHDKQRVACRIAQKAFENKHQTYIHTDNQNDATALNVLLWTFQQNSFVPHALVGDYTDNPPPVEIGSGEKPAHHHDVLINLSDHIPNFAHQFQRVIEILPKNDPQIETRKKHYQTNGFEVLEHQLG